MAGVGVLATPCCASEHGRGGLFHRCSGFMSLLSSMTSWRCGVSAAEWFGAAPLCPAFPAAVSPELGSRVSVAEWCYLERPCAAFCFAGGEFGTLAVELRVVVAIWGRSCARRAAACYTVAIASPQAVVRAQRTRQTCVG